MLCHYPSLLFETVIRISAISRRTLIMSCEARRDPHQRGAERCGTRNFYSTRS